MRPQAERLMLKSSTTSHDIPHGEQGPGGGSWERTEEMLATSGQGDSSISLPSGLSLLCQPTLAWVGLPGQDVKARGTASIMALSHVPSWRQA